MNGYHLAIIIQSTNSVPRCTYYVLIVFFSQICIQFIDIYIYTCYLLRDVNLEITEINVVLNIE